MPIVDATADCVFPEDIMVCILTRLPVKPVIRFKSVCKPWLQLLSTKEFIKMHQAQSSSDPENQTFIVHRIKKRVKKLSSDTLSLFNRENKRPTVLDHPWSCIGYGMDIVGCCNGMFCIHLPLCGQIFHFWNPALNSFKCIRSKREDYKIVSLGFGYEATRDDLMVVRLVCLKYHIEEESMQVDGVEVYSVNSDSWINIMKLEFQFSVYRIKNDVIVNGNPYWFAKVDGEDMVLVCFDLAKLAFKIVSLSTLHYEEEAEVELVDWNGSIGAFVCTVDGDKVEFVEVWVFDDGEQIWRKNHSCTPIEVKLDKYLHCSKTAKVLGSSRDGKAFVSDPQTGGVKALVYGAQLRQPFEIYGYTESLTCIEGMNRVKARKRRKRKLEVDASN